MTNHNPLPGRRNVQVRPNLSGTLVVESTELIAGSEQSAISGHLLETGEQVTRFLPTKQVQELATLLAKGVSINHTSYGEINVYDRIRSIS